MSYRPVHLLGHRCNGIRICAGVTLAACAIAVPHLARAQQVEPQKSAVPPAPYVDRLIDGGALKPFIATDTEDQASTSGNIRSLIIEIGGSRISPKSRTTDVDTAGIDNLQQETGVSVSGRYQTNDFGLLGVDAQLRRGSRDKGVLERIVEPDKRHDHASSADLPLGSGWIANSALGMTVSKSIGLINQQGRFFIPTSPLLGTSMTLNKYARISAQSDSEDPKPAASVNISVGEPGLLGGLRLSDFTALSGIGVSVGGQVDVSRNLTAGFQAVDVENTRDPYSVVLQPSGPSGENAKISSRAVLASIGYRSQGLRLQGNAIWSQLDEASGEPTSLRSPGEAWEAGSTPAIDRAGRYRPEAPIISVRTSVGAIRRSLTTPLALTIGFQNLPSDGDSPSAPMRLTP